MKFDGATRQFFWAYTAGLEFAPSRVPDDHQLHLPHDLVVADLTLLCVRGPSPCQKTAGCDLPDPFHENCAWRHDRSVKQA
jgi:hypothetical protein